MANFKIENCPISAIQLPWGYSMTSKMMKFILNKVNIEKIGIVGGVGYIGNKKAKIDDIFYPKNLVSFNNKYNRIIVVPIANKIFDLPKKAYFFRKNVFEGNIFTVKPKIGKLSYTKNIQGYESIHAYDMEKAAFINSMKNFKKINIASCYYIMDFPYTKLDLGGTYYSYNFLKKLFNQKNRGKYYCYERILHFLTI
jgi:hypothetical protein